MNRGAPWPELVSQMELRERKSAANGHKPQRVWLSIHGYDAVQTATEWEVLIPIKSGSALTHDDVHVAVTATSLNVHVVGQDDKPLVGNWSSSATAMRRHEVVIGTGFLVEPTRVCSAAGEHPLA